MKDSVKLAATMWIPINQDNLPEGEVLAAKFDESGYWMALGYLRVDEEIGLYCRYGISSSYTLDNPTHYFDPKTLKIPPKQNNVPNDGE